MKALLASLLAVAAQTMLSSSVHAFPIPFAIDLSFPFEPSAEQGSLSGSFPNAGSFRVESSLLPSRGNALISFGQISDFSLGLPEFVIGPRLLDQGTCLSAAALPVCGFLFSDGQLQGLVGQYAMPTSNSTYALRFANTSPTLFDTRPIFQGVSIENRQLSSIVASGFVTVRPVPEPLSSILFSVGAGIVGIATHRRSYRKPKFFH